MGTPIFEPISGRYLHLDLLGKPHRLYVEEAGAGIPLLCLHTANSDTRQYRGLLNDEQTLKNFRVIAFDLPYHGKSSPPAGWHTHEYRMTPREYMDIILGVCDALNLDKPVAMGCSIGGRIVLRLALEHGRRFAALIGVQAGAYSERGYGPEWMHRPDIHGGEFAAGLVSGMIGPAASEANRWETLWHYMQGGPGVFKGDLVSYGTDDLRPRAHEIDTGECPLYLLTGEYDYSCTPENTRELERLIKGVKATIMQGVGHFPMSEDPALFLTHLRPVLAEIRAEIHARTQAAPR